MDLTHLETLDMENRTLFDWVHPGDALGNATYISDSSFSLLAPYGGSVDPSFELQDLPPSFDPIAITSITALPQEYYHFHPACKAPALDDFNFDSFPWDDSLQLFSNGEIAADLSITPSEQYCSSSIGYHLDDVSWEERKEYCSGLLAAGQGARAGTESVKKMDHRGFSVRSRSTSISFDEVSKYFCMPIMEAAKAMKVGLTVLKKRCRDLGISRWPHRKMKSLNSLIRNVQELGNGIVTEESLLREVETLEEHKRQMEKMPEMQLSERTKRLRQACFKANFKRRRGVQSPCFNNHPTLLL